jgi:chorismate dehydratase
MPVLGDKSDRLRVGAVSFLNTKPLVYRLAASAPQIELVFDVPSRLADDLAVGRLDAALIPSIELLRDPGYAIVSDACIGCRGPVLSVKLLGRRPLAEVRTLALDESSRTSAVLARILLLQRYGVRPDIEPFPVGTPVQQCGADAVVLIGDRAIHPPDAGFVDQWDLGEEWYRWAGLPFVFAMWVAHRGIDLARLDAPLRAARDAGVANLQGIARQEAAAVGLTYGQTLTYLRQHLHFFFGSQERRGLQMFFREAASLGAIPAGAERVLDDCRVAG